MKPTGQTLREEMEHRIGVLDELLRNTQEEPTRALYMYERATMLELLQLIDIYSNRIGYKLYEASAYTPIKDCETKEPLKIGDYVEDPYGKTCGTLHFDDYHNKYLIKTEEGHNHHTTRYKKIPALYEYTVDTTKVECRPNPHKKKW